MDVLVAELSKYGLTGLALAGIFMLLRTQITDYIRGNSSDTAKLVAAIEKNSEKMAIFGQSLNDMADQFQHNNQMFVQVSHVAGEMVAELRAIKDEIIRGAR